MGAAERRQIGSRFPETGKGVDSISAYDQGRNKEIIVFIYTIYTFGLIV